MSQKIEYLKSIISKKTPDIEAYISLIHKEYKEKDRAELSRKAHFLHCFAKDIPIVLDVEERIVGSMRFWQARNYERIDSMNKGHIVVDYRMILREGIPGIRKKIAEIRTDTTEAFEKVLEAFALFIARYAKEAERAGMADVSANCLALTRHAPQTFYQALQMVWFVHLFLHAEGMAAAVSFGRFDEYLYPFYRRDTENGILTREEAKELLMCFWIKTCEGDESQNLTLGGDIENDLTFLCMEVTCALKLKQPSVSVRTNKNTSEALWDKIIELIKCKIGMPAIFNDTIIQKALERTGVEAEDAANYAIVGCYEANSDGNTFGTTASAGNIYLIDELTEFLDREDEYKNFASFYEGFRKFFTHKYETVILERFRKSWLFIREHLVSPFESICMEGCLESGIPAEWGGCKYTMAGINILGIGTLIDSLYTVKKLVFEEEICDYRAFIEQVKNNFPDPVIAQKCRNLEGKYGTDQEETNQLAEELSGFIADLIENGFIYEGVIPYAGLFIFLQDVRSVRYPATPDGRRRGERLSYGIGASDICTGKTVTTLLNSAAHIVNDRFADGNPLMFGISEKEVTGEKGDQLLKALIQGYFCKGGFHLQINVTDAETLKKAKENPQEYQDLVVRISGYSEHFVKLDDVIQNALIERN